MNLKQNWKGIYE